MRTLVLTMLALLGCGGTVVVDEAPGADGNGGDNTSGDVAGSGPTSAGTGGAGAATAQSSSGAGGDAPCVPSIGEDEACQAAGYCWYAADGCENVYQCGGVSYTTGIPGCELPDFYLVTGCPPDGGQCVPLGPTELGEYLACCPSPWR